MKRGWLTSGPAISNAIPHVYSRGMGVIMISTKKPSQFGWMHWCVETTPLLHRLPDFPLELQSETEATIQRPPIEVVRLVAQRQGVFNPCTDVRLPNHSRKPKYPVLADIASCKESLSEWSRSTIGPGYFAAKGIERLGNSCLTVIEEIIMLIRFNKHSKRLDIDNLCRNISTNNPIIDKSLLDTLNCALELSM